MDISPLSGVKGAVAQSKVCMIVSVAAYVKHTWLQETGGMHTSHCIPDGLLLLAFDTE